jgi:hypothetical protein
MFRACTVTVMALVLDRKNSKECFNLTLVMQWLWLLPSLSMDVCLCLIMSRKCCFAYNTVTSTLGESGQLAVVVGPLELQIREGAINLLLQLY